MCSLISYIETKKKPRSPTVTRKGETYPSYLMPLLPGPLSTFSVFHRSPGQTSVSFSTSSGNPALTLSKGRKGAQSRGAIVGGGSSVSFVRKTSDAGFVIPPLTVQTDCIGDHGVFLGG